MNLNLAVNKVLELEKLKEFAEKVKRRNQIIKKEEKLYESKAKDYIEEIIYEDHEVGDVQAVAIEGIKYLSFIIFHF